MDIPAKSLVRRIPRFSLRAMLVAVLVVAVLVQLTNVYWPTIVGFFEARQYAVLQAGEAKFVEQQRAQESKGGGWSASVDHGRPVPDDFVILVRRGNQFGCFIPRKQNVKGESLEYEWYFRSDGGGRFKPGDPKVESGRATPPPYTSGGGLVRMKFGPFDFEWSGHGKGWGFVYYDSGPEGKPVPVDQQRICTTDAKTLEYLDAHDGRWIYKGYRGDPGIAGDVDINGPVPRVGRIRDENITEEFQQAPDTPTSTQH